MPKADTMTLAAGLKEAGARNVSNMVFISSH
jgi:hypothetical protein